MKAYKFLMCLVAFAGLALSSCSNNEDEIFDQSASARVQALLDETHKTLTSSENGWVLDYYPDRDKSYGGFLYTLKFTEKEVTAACELSEDLSTTVTSLYKMTNDNGATLSFDSYNELLHFFATPSSQNYEALDGDFEFSIIKVEPDLITLRGKRTGNKMWLRRCTEDPAQYLQQCVDMADAMFAPEAAGTVAGKDATAEIDFDTRYLTFIIGDKEYGGYFLPTPTGIRFVEPVEIEGATVSELTFDGENLVFTGNDSKGGAITLTCVVPDSYMWFEDFAGNYTFSCGGGLYTIDVELVAEGDHYLMKGWHPASDITLTYVKSKGCLEMRNQAIGTYNGNIVRVCATGGGSLIPSSNTSGMFIVKDTENEGQFIWTANDDDSYPWDGWCLWMLDANGKSAGQLYGTAGWYWKAFKTTTSTNVGLNSISKIGAMIKK